MQDRDKNKCLEAKSTESGIFPASRTFWALFADGQCWRWLVALRLAKL